MGLLDVFVRDDDARPPWAIVNTPLIRIGRRSLTCVTAYVTAVLLVFLWGFNRTHGLTTFPIYVVLAHLAHLFDAMGSNNTSKNIKNMRKAGFSDWTIVLYYQHTFWFSQLVLGVGTSWLCSDFAIAEELHRVLHVSLWLKALAILALTEVSFTWAHALMHKVPALAELHVMHHCCTNVSLLTNLLFNPLDIYLEFGGGSLVIYGGHFLVFRDQFLLLFTYTLFQLWYMYDHDEGLQLPHARHHATCGSDYHVYITGKGDPKQNVLRHRMSKLLSLHEN